MIDDDVLSFLRTSIRSVWTLELLLLLWRAQDRAWSAAELVRELRASDSIVFDGIAALQAAGLVVSEGKDGFRYKPASSVLDLLLQRLAQLYRERPMVVTRALFASPEQKLQTFADAFRLKKD